MSLESALTVLFCEAPHRATKIFTGETVVPYDAGAWFSHAEIPIAGIGALAEAIAALRACPEALVIRGAVREGAPARILRRYRESQGYAPQIVPCPRSWVCLDFDDTRVPVGEGTESAVRGILETLPEGLREASCVWQVSASAHRYQTFRGHLWFVLDRAYSDQELKRSLRGTGCDLALMNPVQPHYVADPIFDGPDPIPIRSGLLRGATDTATIKGAGATRLLEMAEGILDQAEKAVRKAIKSKAPRHDVVNREAFRLGQLCPHLLNEGDVFRRLYAVATDGEGALPPDRAQDEIRRAIEDGKGKPELRGEDWKGLLIYGKGYSPLPTESNVTTILENDPRWSDVLAYNDREAKDWYRRAPPLTDVSARIGGDSSVTDQDPIAIGQWLQRTYGFAPGARMISECLSKVCHESPFDPVEEYLSGLEWDLTDRLGNVPRDLFGDPSQVAREAFVSWAISAVRRVFEPGCQSDHTIVLEGPQGLRKSSFWEWLASPRWYGQLKSDVTSKDSVIALQSAWILDMSELASLRRADIAAMKDFLTTRVDKIRLPYGRREIAMPRRCAIAATHNPEDGEGYLKDRTGNRRIWPIVVTQTIAGLSAELRDALWAEARARYLAGETSWELSDQALEELASRHEERLEDPPLRDPWTPSVREYLAKSTAPTTASVLTAALHVPLERMTHRDRRRVEQIGRALGWVTADPWVAPLGHVPRAGVLVPLRAVPPAG